MAGIEPGTWPLGADATLNLFAALVQAAGGRAHLDVDQVDFTAEDFIKYTADAAGFDFVVALAPTVVKIDAALTAIGIDPATATDAQREWMRQLIRSIELGG